MMNRRNFLQSALAAAGVYMLPAALFPKAAQAQTVSAGVANWADVSDSALMTRVWGVRFSNTLPWALDPTNTVLAKALNIDALGNVPVLGAQLIPEVLNGTVVAGFNYHPDGGVGNTYTVKAGQTPWPMLAPLGNAAGIPATTTWGYGNGELENIFVGGGGLGVTFPGRTFVVQRGQAINVNWTNNLVDATGKELPHLLGVDQSISMQNDQSIHHFDPATQQETFSGNAIQGVPIAMHHHGGDTAKEFDGGPDQWIAPRRVQVGPGVSANNSNANGLAYTYLNNQEAAMTWYHDHGEGVTRINAYGGLAGLYVIRDANEAKLIAQAKIPSGPYEVPVVIQDKCFAADGSMAYAGDPATYPVQLPLADGTPSADGITALPAPTHHPEQFGDIIIVNGVAWPNLDVEPREYRLRLLNGSDSRVYNLKFGYGGQNLRRGGFNNYLPVFKISNDLGLLNTPVEMLGQAVVLAPGERMDVVVDFSKVQSAVKGGPKMVVVTNDAPTPFPGVVGMGPVPGSMGPGTIMQFNVKLALNAATAALGTPIQARSRVASLKTNLLLRGLDPATPVLPRLTVPAGTKVRRVLLGEGLDEFGRIMPLMGALSLQGDAALPNGYDTYGQALNNPGTLSFSQMPSETPTLGSTEVWEIWNSTVDAHPIHLHLVKFRIINRQVFTAPSVNATPMVNGWTGVQLAADAAGTPMTAAEAFVLPDATGAPTTIPSLPVACPAHEAGWKDTVLCYPGEVTRIVMKFDRPGKYVYHCHILSHEEHDMMRWYEVI